MVLLTDATDKVFVYTDMPCPYVKAFLPSQEPLVLTFDATYDMGVEYVRNHFAMEPKIVNVRRNHDAITK